MGLSPGELEKMAHFGGPLALPPLRLAWPTVPCQSVRFLWNRLDMQPQQCGREATCVGHTIP